MIDIQASEDYPVMALKQRLTNGPEKYSEI